MVRPHIDPACFYYTLDEVSSYICISILLQHWESHVAEIFVDESLFAIHSQYYGITWTISTIALTYLFCNIPVRVRHMIRFHIVMSWGWFIKVWQFMWWALQSKILVLFRKLLSGCQKDAFEQFIRNDEFVCRMVSKTLCVKMNNSWQFTTWYLVQTEILDDIWLNQRTYLKLYLELHWIMTMRYQCIIMNNMIVILWNSSM